MVDLLATAGPQPPPPVTASAHDEPARGRLRAFVREQGLTAKRLSEQARILERVMALRERERGA